MKLLQLVLVLIISAAVAVGAATYVTAHRSETGGAAAGAHETAYDRILHTGVLRCGYGISPPHLVKNPDTNQLSGMDYDIWQQVGVILNLKIEWSEEAGWGNFIEGLRDGRYDAFCSSMFPDPSRITFLSLTTPTMYSLSEAYVRADDHRFDGDLEKLNTPDVIIPVIDGDVSATAFQARLPKAHMLSLPQTATASDLFIAVTSGKADAMFFDEAMFAALDKANPGKLRKLERVAPALIFSNNYGFAAGEIRLRDMIDIALHQLIDSGKMNEIARVYSSAYLMPHRDFDLMP